MCAPEKGGESGGMFPTVRHEHLLGFIGRSHSPAQAQAEEREERRRLDWDRGNTIFTFQFHQSVASIPHSALLGFSTGGSAVVVVVVV